jgi:arginyl-tRNA synthetase
MQTVLTQLETAFRAAIAKALGRNADPLVNVSQNEKFGDYQSNAAMGLAKSIAENGQKPNPQAVAKQIIAALDLGAMADPPAIAGPGFINVRLRPDWVAERLLEITGDPRLGIERVAHRQTVVVDYSGPNVAKEMHVGHLRTTVLGDALARLLDFQGHTVIRQNHIGDWGTQFGMLIAFLREHGSSGQEALADIEGFYRKSKQRFDADSAFAGEARQTVVRLQAGGAQELELWRQILDQTRRHYQPIYKQMGVKLTLEDERGESFYNSALPDVVKELATSGIARGSDGAMAVFVEGYETPLLVQKTDGGYLYGTTDLAAIRYRSRTLHADRIIYNVDTRQSEHFAKVFATARRVGWADGVLLEFASFGTILGPDNKPFKTRSGESVKLQELLDEAVERAKAVVDAKSGELSDSQRLAIARAVGIGAIKYADLSKDRSGDYVFSWEKMLALDGNTAPYLQYAYARTQSIFRKAGGKPSAWVAAPKLESPFEIALAKQILRLGEVIELVTRELRPHHLCTYLYDLATRFSSFWDNCDVLKSAEPIRTGRLLLCDLAGRTMALGLDLLGIEHPEQM